MYCVVDGTKATSAFLTTTTTTRRIADWGWPQDDNDETIAIYRAATRSDASKQARQATDNDSAKRSLRGQWETQTAFNNSTKFNRNKTQLKTEMKCLLWRDRDSDTQHKTHTKQSHEMRGSRSPSTQTYAHTHIFVVVAVVYLATIYAGGPLSYKYIWTYSLWWWCWCLVTVLVCTSERNFH